MAGTFNLQDYVTVNERIEKFYEKYPEGSIQTEILLNENGLVVIKASVFRDREDNKPSTGHGMEKEGSTFINKTSHLENCETSAVGRALAMMGFEIKKSIASREEVENAKLNQELMNEAEVYNAKPIDKVKVATIASMLEKSKSNVPVFLEYYKIKSVADITNSQFNEVMQALEKKLGEAK